MKRTIKSIILLLIVSSILLGTVLPIAALSLDSSSANTDHSTVSEISEIPISERYHVIKNGYLGKYDLKEGIYGHQSAQQVNKNAVYFYSDGYFADTPDTYNPSLSTMSLALAKSAFNAMRTDFDMSLPNGSYSNLFRHAKVLMSDLGFKDKDILINDSFDIRPTEETIGMIMGAKEISLDNSNYILIPIAVRGGDYEAEWSSNVTLGASGEAFGFASAASRVLEQIENYITGNTSFDIASALNEGRVKFWVVGYSRGGAVANITAKRLTDVYGKSGNSIYAYCFEAPAGGVDAAETNEAWTYNGIYANIHNVINPIDLVPKIPPKQMGFKRYGIDHYIPGTDAGEIVTSTYVTPTGITVTTRADNTALVVGSDEYNERRAKMLYYLSAIDSNITFSDEFSVARIDLAGALSSGLIFDPIDAAKDVSAAEWLDYFIEDLLIRTANGTYSYGSVDYGGYNNDYRKFYTSNSFFAGEEHVTVEVAMQHVLKLAFTYYYDEEFLNTLLYRSATILLDRFTLIDMYFNAFQKWDMLSYGKQDKYLDKIWGYLNADLTLPDGTPVKKITDFVTPDEQELIKDSVYTLSSFLLLWISKEYKTPPSIDGVNSTLVHLVTLIANGKTLLQGHFPEICLAWLSTYDDNYSHESSKYLGSEIELINDQNNSLPQVKSEIDVQDGKTKISLSSIINSSFGVDSNSKDNGSAIYFAVFENGSMVDTWQLYRTPITIDTANDTDYTVKAFALRFESIGETLEISDDDIRTSPKLPEIPDNDTNEENEPPCDFPTATVVIIAVSSAALIVFTTLFIRKKKK